MVPQYTKGGGGKTTTMAMPTINVSFTEFKKKKKKKLLISSDIVEWAWKRDQLYCSLY
jgi:hypothetical protein